MAAAECCEGLRSWRALGCSSPPCGWCSLAYLIDLAASPPRIERILWPDWVNRLSRMGKPRSDRDPARGTDAGCREGRGLLCEMTLGPYPSSSTPNWCHPAEARSLWSSPDSQVVGFIRTTHQSLSAGTDVAPGPPCSWCTSH